MMRKMMFMRGHIHKLKNSQRFKKMKHQELVEIKKMEVEELIRVKREKLQLE